MSYRWMSLCIALALAPAAQAAEPDSVTMDLAEFLKLYEESKTRPDKPMKAPKTHALTSASYDGEVVLEDGEPIAARFTARFHVENLSGDWIRVPLLQSSVAVSDARIGGRPAPVMYDGGTYTLVTDQKGGFDVDIDFAVSVSTSQGSSGFSFPLIPAGGSELTLSVPASDALDFTVPNARLKTDRTAGGRRIVEAVLPSQGSLAVRWQREITEEEQREVEPRIYAEVQTLATLGEGVLTTRTWAQDSILFAGADTLRFDVPEGMTVLDVRGSGLRDWTVDGKVLTAQLNFEAEGSYQLQIDCERVLEESESGAVEIPIVKPVGVERAKGWVGVTALGAVELAAGDIGGAAAVDVRTLPGTIIGTSGTPVLLGYKYLGDAARIPITVSEHEEVDVLVTLLDEVMGTTMFTEDGRRLTSVHYQVRNNRRQFLRVSLPEGAELWSASVAGSAVQPARSSDGRVLLPLIRSQASGGALASFGVEVVYVEGGEAPSDSGRGTFAADLPTADAPSTWVGWTVYAPWDAKIVKNSFDGSLRHVDYLSQPASYDDYMEVSAQTAVVQNQAAAQVAHGGMGEGAAPVKVSVPVDGQALHFEKLLVLGEDLEISFDYKGL